MSDIQKESQQDIGSEKRWRMVLGEAASNLSNDLTEDELRMDRALEALYDGKDDRGRRGGLGASSPKITKWMGDIRKYFPTQVVQIIQKDAIERLNITEMLLEPEVL